MRFVAIGLLAAILGVGCAIQPGEATDGDPSLTAPGSESNRPDTSHMPLIRPGGSPTPASSFNPEPAPWKIGSPINGASDPGTNQNPEPAPWKDNPGATTGTGTTGGPETSGNSNGTGSSGKSSTGSAAKVDPHVHHWDLWNETVN